MGIIMAAVLAFAFGRLTARANHRLALEQARAGRILDRKVELYEQMVIWSGYLADRRAYLLDNSAPDPADMPKSPFPDDDENQRARTLDARLLIISTPRLRAASKKQMNTDFKFDQAVRNWNKAVDAWKASGAATKPSLVTERAKKVREFRAEADAADAELLEMVRSDLGIDLPPRWWAWIPLLGRLGSRR